ncbi:hypothetical protein AAG570_014034 [Ranatra chinensis]|uniref:ABC transporter domain-containing protein n=1 Tax=Ranatra chinensis TaxID=642074 RepID=A0ABD0XSG4_9HEMI
MKQKLALIVSLMKVPKILLLDEPTVGVDPLSRKELWEILEKLISDEDITVLVSTSYMDEAEIADMVLMLDNGKVILDAPPDDMRKKAEGMSYNISAEDCPVLREAFYEVSTAPGVMDIVPAGGGLHFISTDISYLEKYHPKPVKPSVEDGFMTVLKYNPSHGLSASANFARKRKDEVIIEAKGLVKKFGDFTAVNSTSFTVTRGEIFGLLGPNGAGKTTTFRMMCGLIPPTEGDLKVVGIDAKKAALEVRKRLGYMAQKFSLYQDLTVIENLDFFASAYALRTEQKHDRIESVVKQFDLGKALNWQTKTLPGGFKQRLSMAVALLHNPEILFLDEPTSGADPVARREFWRTILRLSDGGTTIIVTTHFMEEAEYCDKVMIQDHGNMLAIGTPKEIRGKAEGASNMNDAFIKIIEKARDEH